MEILIGIVSLIVGGIITWFVSQHYYKRSSIDFESLFNRLENISKDNSSLLSDISSEESRIQITQNSILDSDPIIFSGLDDSFDKSPRIEQIMHEIEDVLSKYQVMHDTDSGGMSISLLNDLYNRIESVAQVVKRYRNWRVHLGD